MGQHKKVKAQAPPKGQTMTQAEYIAALREADHISPKTKERE